MNWDEAAIAIPEANQLYRDVLSKEEEWPVISVGLAARHWLRIVYRNFSDDMGMDFLVDWELGGQAATVAGRGHTVGPGMCWQGIIAVAAMADETLTYAQRFLLCLPVLGGPLPHDAKTVLQEALQQVMPRDWAPELADLLLADVLSGAQFHIRHGVRMCTGPGSYRHVQDMSLNQLRHVDEAFGARFYRNRYGSKEYAHREAGRSTGRWRFTVSESRAQENCVRLSGHLDGEIRDGEPALLGPQQIPAIHLEWDNGLVLRIDGNIPLPQPAAQLLPAD
ncbi:hypothetical protein Rhe02_20890 [Rhizocola hellebori]|uniref:Uncharacterized protein n=2 Tax=Rhizocola hellebori TaxID=1392758 RepID=A0A8J3Q5Y4_9ACTN|nr:hypothetical protein Rhe02_20890 [Rhizocola hellebori]